MVFGTFIVQTTLVKSKTVTFHILLLLLLLGAKILKAVPRLVNAVLYISTQNC